MPFTYLSHQAPALALKMAKPRWFDGTALVFGSMTPDFAYALQSTPWSFDAHRPLPLVWFCVPATMLICWAVRKRVATVAFAQLPNTSLRLHDYRVLACRRPALTITAISAFVGALTHCVWDTFTHNDRWGVRHVAILREHVATIHGNKFTLGRTLQYVSHVLGAIITVLLMLVIANRRLLRRWYGHSYDELPPVALTLQQRVTFWSFAALGLVTGSVWALIAGDGLAAQVIRASLGMGAGIGVASLLPSLNPTKTSLDARENVSAFPSQ